MRAPSCVELRHRGFGEVAAIADLPLVVDLDEDRAREAQHASFVGAPLCQAEARSRASWASARMAS